MARHSPYLLRYHIKVLAIALWCICSMVIWATFFIKSTVDMLDFEHQKPTLQSYYEHRPVLFHILTTHQGLVRYFYGHSEEWLAELQSVGNLAFTIGRDNGNEGRSHAVIQNIRKRWPDIHILEIDVDDLAYPPINKTIAAFEHLSVDLAHKYDFIYNLDDDTQFHPLRLAAILASRRPDAPLYMGRPLQNCLCEVGQPKGLNCTSSLATNYCSGAGYAFSSFTMKQMAGIWNRCWAEHAGTYYALCRSSDTFIGRCLNRYVATPCTAANIHPYDQNATIHNRFVPDPSMYPYILAAVEASQSAKASQKPSHGVSWGAIQADGWSLHIHTLFCQDMSHIGGVKQRYHIPNPHLFDLSDHELCAYMHPMRVNGMLSAPHQRYARFLMNGHKSFENALLDYSTSATLPLGLHPEKYISSGQNQELFADWQEDSHSPRRCRLAINIQSDPAQIEQRNALRATWVKIAKLIGNDTLRVYFVVGSPKEPLAPHLQVEFDREVATMPDMLKLEFTECYHCVFHKLMMWYDWALANTDCDYIAKVDDDVYLRVIPLLNFLASLGPGRVDDVYFGMAFYGWDKYNTSMASRVVQDPSHVWYLHDLYPHEYLPPYVTGNLMGLSRNLVKYVVEYHHNRPQDWRVDDAAIGIFLSELVTNTSTGAPLIYANDLEVFGAYHTCCSDTVWDSPNFSFGYNIYDRYEDDLSGNFCSRIDRSGSPDSRARDINKRDMLLYSPEKRRALHYVHTPWEPGFNVRDSAQGSQLVSDWWAIGGSRLFGGAEVMRDTIMSDPVLANELKSVGKRARAYAVSQGACKASNSATILATWHQETKNGGYLSLSKCEERSHLASLVMLPSAMAPGVAERPVSLTGDKMAIVIGAACFVGELEDLLSHLQSIFDQKAGPIRIIVGWGTCPDKSIAVHQPNDNQKASNDHTGIEPEELLKKLMVEKDGVHISIVRTGKAFSRSTTLAAALEAATPNELVVILDTDMRVTPSFFVTVRAMVVQTISIYFPIPFSRYNPRLIEKNLELQEIPPAERDYFHRPFTILKSTGHWVEYGYGMVAGFASDLKRLTGYDANNTEWGMEDVAIYQSAKASDLNVLRLTETNLVHIWHPKSCAPLKEGASGRYRMCLGTKWSSEGDSIMIGLDIEDIEEDKVSN